METRYKFLVGSFLLVGAVAYLMYSGVQQTAVYYLTIAEFEAKKASLADDGVRVAGRVQPGTVQRRMTPEGEEFEFRIGDFTDTPDPQQPTVPVYYLGVAPDMFKNEGGSDVIVEGKFRNGRLEAQNVMTSCPSKYEAGKGDSESGAPAAGEVEG